MNSLLYAANTTAQAVAVNGVINFGSIVRRYGNCINLSGGNVDVKGVGYYNIDANFTATTTAGGTATITLYKNGVAIPGAVATMTIAANGTNTVSIPAVIREVCYAQDTITAVVTGIALSVTNASIVVEKV